MVCIPGPNVNCLALCMHKLVKHISWFKFLIKFAFFCSSLGTYLGSYLKLCNSWIKQFSNNNNIKTFCLPSELHKKKRNRILGVIAWQHSLAPVCTHDWRLPSGDLTFLLHSCPLTSPILPPLIFFFPMEILEIHFYQHTGKYRCWGKCIVWLAVLRQPISHGRPP